MAGDIKNFIHISLISAFLIKSKSQQILNISSNNDHK